MSKGVWLQDLTWPEAKDRFDAGAVVVIPIGAASKEHGHHLPLCTDLLLAEGITNRLLAELPVVAAPVLTQGYYPAFRHYPGSQSISPETYAAMLDETMHNFVSQGARKLVIINTGISTEPVVNVRLREFYEATGVRVMGAHISRLGRDTDAMMEQKFGGHGDEHETSIILALAPERVRMEKAKADYGNIGKYPKTVFYIPTIFDGDPDTAWDYTETGVRGDPSLATAEKGEKILAAITRDLVQGITALFPEAG